MKSVLAVIVLVPSLAFAAEEKASASPDDPMAGWVPPKVTNAAKDKQEIQGLFRSIETAGRTGDLDAAAALVDFPVTMLTDDSKGEASGEAWSREQWVQAMKPMYDKPAKDVKIAHKPTIFLLTDSLATVDDVCTMSRGGKTITTRSAMFVVRKDGKWRVKAMAEGGWGDMMAAASRPAATGAQGPSPEGTGSAAEQPGSQPARKSAQAPSERTTR